MRIHDEVPMDPQEETQGGGSNNKPSPTTKKKVTPFMLFIITLTVIAVCITLFTLLNK